MSDFSKLDIDGSIISEFRAVPSKKFVMTLLRGPQSVNDRAVQTEQDLQFNEVKCFRIAIQAEPWLQVVSHGLTSESEYLHECLATAEGRPTEGNTLFHFEVVCGQGRIDIIASSVTLSLTNEIAYVQH
jgi:hypothetical protein